MNRYLSSVLLVVNVSPVDDQFQKQLDSLNDLKDKFAKEQFSILAFPSSQLDNVKLTDREMKEKLTENNIVIYENNINFFNRVTY